MPHRIADVHDVDALVPLVEAFRDHLGAVRPTTHELGATLPDLLQEPSSLFALAHAADGQAIAYSYARIYTNLWASGREAHLEDLFVCEAARGRGVGQGLLEFTVDQLRGRGALAIGLHTNERNTQAQALYQRAGFVPQTEERWHGGREVYWIRRLASGLAE